MSFYLFLAAAFGCFLGAGFHGIYGRRIYLAALVDSRVPHRTLSLSTVSWDMFTILLAVSGLTLCCVATLPEARWMAYPILAIHGLGAGLFAGLAMAGHQALARLPGGYLQGLIAGLIWLAL